MWFRLGDPATTVGACDEATKESLNQQNTQLEATKTELDGVKVGEKK